MAAEGSAHGRRGPETGRRLFDRIRRTSPVRAENGWFGGLASLVADRLHWDATLVRGIVFVACLFFFPPMALTYGLLWILLPDAQGRIHLQQSMRGDHRGGFLAGGLLTLLGTITLISPFNLAGAVGIILNLLVLSGLIWLVVRVIRHSRRAEPESGGTSSTSSAQTSTGHPAGHRHERADGRPAWYPRTEAAGNSARAPGDATASAVNAAGHQAPRPGQRSGSERPAAQTRKTRVTKTRVARSSTLSPEQREARRRRRQLTFGVLLLAVPVLVGVMFLGGVMGVSVIPVLLLVTAVTTLVLAALHIIAALRGRRGRSLLLTAVTATMLLLFAMASGPPVGGGTSHAFSQQTTDSTSVSSAFSSTIVDLQQLDPNEAAENEAGVSVYSADISTAFSSVEVIVPDNVEVVVEVDQAFGSITARTADAEHDMGGLSSRGFTLGPTDADTQLQLSVDAAFNSLEIYDASTYAQEKGNDADSGEDR